MVRARYKPVTPDQRLRDLRKEFKGFEKEEPGPERAARLAVFARAAHDDRQLNMAMHAAQLCLDEDPDAPALLRRRLPDLDAATTRIACAPTPTSRTSRGTSTAPTWSSSPNVRSHDEARDWVLAGDDQERRHRLRTLASMIGRRFADDLARRARPGAPAEPPSLVTFDDVARAARRLAGVAHWTPVLTSTTLGARTGGALHLKAEHLQRVGAFKFRGAYNAIAALDRPTCRARGIVAFSSGNHAQAVALACRLQGVRATIVMPHDAPPVKLAATRGLRRRGRPLRPVHRGPGRDRRGHRRGAGRDRRSRPSTTRTSSPGRARRRWSWSRTSPTSTCWWPRSGAAACSPAAPPRPVAWSPDVEVIGVEPADRRAARDALATGEVVEVRRPADRRSTASRRPHIGALPLAILRATRRRGSSGSSDDGGARPPSRGWRRRAKQVVEPSGRGGAGRRARRDHRRAGPQGRHRPVGRQHGA